VNVHRMYYDNIRCVMFTTCCCRRQRFFCRYSIYGRSDGAEIEKIKIPVRKDRKKKNEKSADLPDDTAMVRKCVYICVCVCVCVCVRESRLL
jgi:hypothetical protein